VAVGMADLIEALWGCGYRTVSSCECQEDADNHAWVAFDTVYQGNRFAARLGDCHSFATADNGGVIRGVVGFKPERIGEAIAAVLG
jgi:hypothetical protein